MTNGKTFKVLGEELDIIDFPVLYRWQQTNPDTLAESLKALADKWYDGNIGSAAAMYESDLEHETASDDSKD